VLEDASGKVMPKHWSPLAPAIHGCKMNAKADVETEYAARYPSSELHPLAISDFRGDGKRYVVRADEKLTAFLELESAFRKRNYVDNWRAFRKTRRRQTDLSRANDASPGSGFSCFRPAIAELNQSG